MFFVWVTNASSLPNFKKGVFQITYLCTKYSLRLNYSCFWRQTLLIICHHCVPSQHLIQTAHSADNTPAQTRPSSWADVKQFAPLSPHIAFVPTKYGLLPQTQQRQRKMKFPDSELMLQVLTDEVLSLSTKLQKWYLSVSETRWKLQFGWYSRAPSLNTALTIAAGRSRKPVGDK